MKAMKKKEESEKTNTAEALAADFLEAAAESMKMAIARGEEGMGHSLVDVLLGRGDLPEGKALRLRSLIFCQVVDESTVSLKD